MDFCSLFSVYTIKSVSQPDNDHLINWQTVLTLSEVATFKQVQGHVLSLHSTGRNIPLMHSTHAPWIPGVTRYSWILLYAEDKAFLSQTAASQVKDSYSTKLTNETVIWICHNIIYRRSIGIEMFHGLFALFPSYRSV